jgi:hypothetical protein
MWDVLQKEIAVQKVKTALRVDVAANAVRRLRKGDADGRVPAWAVGSGNDRPTRKLLE